MRDKSGRKPSSRSKRQSKSENTPRVEIRDLLKELQELVHSKGFQALVGLFITGILLGYAWGRAWSPRWDDPTESPALIRAYVVNANSPWLRDQFYRIGDKPYQFKRFYYKDGRLARLAAEPKILAFGCATTTYVYDVSTGRVQSKPLSPEDKAIADLARPRRGIGFTDALLLFLGGLEGYQLRSAGPRVLSYVVSAGSEAGAVRRILSGAVTFATGVGLGFYMGYDNRPRCGERVFQGLLRDEERTFWASSVNEYRIRNSWYINYDAEGLPILEKRGGALVSGFKYLDLQHALEVTGEGALLKGDLKISR
jgi:hypothetical protein